MKDFINNTENNMSNVNNINIINEKKIKGTDQEKEYIPPISISNHVTWIDIICLLSTKYTPSFLSKIGAK